MADLFDASLVVESWLRVDENVPLSIRLFDGCHGRQYEQDFIVIDDEQVRTGSWRANATAK